MSRRPRPPPKPRTVDRNAEQDPVEVFCRIRPQENPEEDVCVSVVDVRTVKVILYSLNNRWESFIAHSIFEMLWD